MISFVETDQRVSIREQLADTGGSAILMNTFRVEPEEAEQLLAAWAKDAEWMKQQPGFISTQLYRGIAGSGTFVNHAVWESVAHFQRAFNNPEFRKTLGHYPPSTVASPHLFRKIAVAGICVG
jgi:heme-degrading monooxygenase HmoA